MAEGVHNRNIVPFATGEPMKGKIAPQSSAKSRNQSRRYQAVASGIPNRQTEWQLKTPVVPRGTNDRIRMIVP
jgi:hypothetical protein